MKKIYVLVCVFGFAVANLLNASSHQVKMLSVDIDLHDKAKLQRGARMFMNYCSGCHSLHYLRYNRMAQDLGLTTFDGKIDQNLLVSNLIFTQAKIHDPIDISMPATDARQWFGVLPPDLSLSARKRGASWLYTYLKSFYEDNSRPFKSNNLLIPGVAMPNILAPLSGRAIAVKEKANDPNSPIDYLLQIKPGTMSIHEFDSALEDLVTFLVYVGEPAKLTRYRIGGFVIAYLAILLVVVYQLKKLYWKRLKKPKQQVY